MRTKIPSWQRKGQINMMETIGVLFIFFILVLFGLIFYFKFQEVSFSQKEVERSAFNAIDLTLVTLFLPELQCSDGIAEADDNCVDIIKLRALQEIMQNDDLNYRNEYYFNLFGYSTITVREVFPATNTEEFPDGREWIVYDKEKTRISDDDVEVRDWRIKEPTYFVVALRDYTHGFFESTPSLSVYSYGYVMVEVYT
jgi:hypothetical protein